MKIAVAGGTGVVGRHVVARIESLGHSALTLSRRSGVDLVSASGLPRSLVGVDAIIDVTNSTSLRRSRATSFFTDVATNLQEAANEVGARHVVTLSIVGLERADMYGYYAAKLEHERAARRGNVPASVVRATQFHEFAGQLMSRAHVGSLAFVADMPVQSIAAHSVAEVLVTTALGKSREATLEIAGPQVGLLATQAKLLARRIGSPRRVVALRPIGRLGRAVKSGALLATTATSIIGPSFAEWLEQTYPLDSRGVSNPPSVSST